MRQNMMILLRFNTVLDNAFEDNMKILYYDCFAGISGDMNLGAMIDLGVDPSHLKAELKKLPVREYEIGFVCDVRKGITGTRADVIVKGDEHAALKHGKGRQKAKDADNHRRYSAIKEMIDKSRLSDPVKSNSGKIFKMLAEAEAKIHGCAVDDIHFHEIGAVDSIVDIVGASICLDYLKVDRVICSPVQVGGGFVKCAHGTLPVPAPATAELLKGVPVKSGLVPFEMTTPTGAAILRATVSEFSEQVHFTAERIGYGIGRRDTDVPNVLRVYLGSRSADQSAGELERGEALLLECNIDDMNPEFYEDVINQLFKKGAQDVFLTSIMMKKSRPAVKISVLCNEDAKKSMEDVLLLQTSTLGLRTTRIQKTMLKRAFSKKKTKFGTITFKDAYYGGRKVKSKPEYEEIKKLADEKGVSVYDIYGSLKADK